MKRSMPAAVLGLLLGATAARAHDADLIYVRVEHGAPGELFERVTLTPGTLEQLIPPAPGGAEPTRQNLDERRAALEAGIWDEMPLSSSRGPCTRLRTGAAVREGYVELSGQFACPPDELTQTFRLLSLLPAGYRVILDAGAGQQRFAQGTEQTLLLPAPATARAGEAGARGLGGWIALGVHHIFTGHDHLAFLLALLLGSRSWRRVLWMVTAFTVAHSITLGATALGAVVLDPVGQRWVEAAIAASIIYVAAENLVLREHRHRAVVTFGFGLVHGFGFASVLQSYGLGRSVATALFGFNLGVEVGQACVVGALFPLVGLLQRRQVAGVWMTRVVSVAILAAGGFWLMDRTLG